MEGTIETECESKVWKTETQQCQNPIQPDGPRNKHRREQATSPLHNLLYIQAWTHTKPHHPQNVLKNAPTVCFVQYL